MARARRRKAPKSERRPRWSDSDAAEALRAMPEAVVVADRSGRIVAANDALHALLGYPDGKLVGRKLEKLVPEALRDLHQVHRETFAVERGPGAHRAGRLLTARHRDGRTIRVDIAVANLRADDGPLSLALLRDMDDPAIAGKQLAELADLYAVMARALSAVLHADSNDELYAAVCDVAVDHAAVELAWVGRVADGTVQPVSVSGPLADAVEGRVVRLGDDHPVALAVSLGSPVVVPDLALDPVDGLGSGRWATGRSMCVLPLRGAGRVEGILALVSPRVSGFGDDIVTILEWLAAEVAYALDRLVRTQSEPPPVAHEPVAAPSADVVPAPDASPEAAEPPSADDAEPAEEPVALEDPLPPEPPVEAPIQPVEAPIQPVEAPTQPVEPAAGVDEPPGPPSAAQPEPDLERVAGQEPAADHEPASDGDGTPDRLEVQVRRDDVAIGLALLAVATRNPVDIADAVVEAAGQALGVDSAVLVESAPGQRATIRAAWFGTEAALDESHPDPHADLHAVVVADGGPLVVDDLRADPRLAGVAPPAGSPASGLAVVVGGAPGFHGSLSVLSASPRAFDADEVAFLERLADIVASSFERARADLEPDHQRLEDQLTRLPNRALLRDRIDQTISRLRGSDLLIAVLIVHVDGLDELVDGYGPEVVDALLVSLAERLRHATESEDVVARLRADEFAVLHVSPGTVETVTDVADRLRVALTPAFEVDGVALRPTTSIGVSLHPAREAEADRLLREADAAADRAARSGPDRVELFDHDLRRQARQRIDQATALRRAIEDDELVVVWQAALPLQPVTTEPAPAIWAEALVRWRNPERGLISPGNFIDLAEETGLIVPVGDTVLRKACQQLATWQRTGDPSSPSRICVNLSPRQLARSDLAAHVADTLAQEGVDPAAVIFEITESALTREPEDAHRRLNELREVGVQVAMDDFGTGYSSLGYLRQLPVSVLKIDQSFIRGLAENRADWAIVHGIIEMGHGIGLTVVAEGVETAAQLDHLVVLGCDRGQGYYWSSPVPADALDLLLATWTRPDA